MCAKQIIETRDEEIRVCECQNAAHAEFDEIMMRCQQLDTESAIEECEVGAKEKLMAALDDCLPKEPTCQEIAENTYYE
jgi:hypothetical protein